MWSFPDILTLAKQATFLPWRNRPALNNPADVRTMWDIRYTRHGQRALRRDYERWLDRWEHLWGQHRGARAFDMGCGEGHDVRYLIEQGFYVIAVDGSRVALAVAQQIAPQAQFFHVDFREGLPFAAGTFKLIIANLSLHYFDHEQTQQIVDDVLHCLAPGGFLIARVNSSHDDNFGATGHPEVEPGYFLVDGEYKRFFTRRALVSLGSQQWTLHSLEELTIHRYGKPKVIWEIVAQKKLDQEKSWRRNLRWPRRS